MTEEEKSTKTTTVTRQGWSEPLRTDNELSNANSWREAYGKNEATLRPRIQDINSCRA